MPQITVDYPDRLAGHFDRPAFAHALHTATVEIAGATLPACKTRFLRSEAVTVGDQPDGHAVVNVSIALMAGRTDEVKGELAEAAVALLRKYVQPVDGLVLHLSAEIRELETSYRKHQSD